MPPLTEEAQMEALHFKHPAISDEMFLALYEGKHIPLRGHLGQNYVDFTNYEEDEDHRNDRLEDIIMQLSRMYVVVSNITVR